MPKISCGERTTCFIVGKDVSVATFPHRKVHTILEIMNDFVGTRNGRIRQMGQGNTRSTLPNNSIGVQTIRRGIGKDGSPSFTRTFDFVPTMNVQFTSSNEEGLLPRIQGGSTGDGLVGGEHNVGVTSQDDLHGGVVFRDGLIIRHFEFTLDENVGSVESRLVVSGDMEFTDNVETTDGNLGSKIVHKTSSTGHNYRVGFPTQNS
mmetsp:Transcript_12096/g.19950  ORF Transcript_12096/g.19950 Transcript_12096/m.19950 type:complete len:205 (-) Transcript_12096:297-911(-)